MSNRLLHRADDLNLHLHAGDALRVLRGLRTRSISCIVTSPPYFGHIIYEGGSGLGNEGTVEEYLETLAAIFRECMRVLRDDGTLWIVLGDTWRGGEQLAIPDLLALTLTIQDWIRRHRFIWDKQDQGIVSPKLGRYTHEDIQAFSKQRNGFYVDDAALRVPMGAGECRAPDPRSKQEEVRRWPRIRDSERATAVIGLREDEANKALVAIDSEAAKGRDFRIILRGQKCQLAQTEEVRRNGFKMLRYSDKGAKWGSVWRIAPEHRDFGGHPCPMPEELARRCIAATCPPDGLVLDPFCGVGSVGVAAGQLGRRFIGIDVHEPYLRIAEQRLRLAVPGCRVHLW